MTPSLPVKRVRPYWHVDLKWICGILLFFMLGAALLFYNLSALTERERAVTLSATIVASLFSKDGLDDEKGLEAERQKVAAMPGNDYRPLPQFPNVSLTKEQVATLSARELRLAIFRQVTEPIYDKGVEGAAAAFTSDPAKQKEFSKNATLLGVFTKDVHQKLQRLFLVTAIGSLLLMAALIYFSAGWGRAFSPGIILLAISPVGSVLGLLLLHPPKDGDAPFAALPGPLAQEMGASLSRSYVAATILGTILLLVAFAGKVTQKLRGSHATVKSVKKSAKT